MYGKIFDSIYDGTLCGHWEAIVTMQQLIVLADADGMVDMTPLAIATRTSIPLDIIAKGLKLLAEPDPYSRTPGEEGRRIEPMDSHRPWGWHLVNHEKYKNLKDADEVRAQNRERQQRFRDRNGVTPRNAPSREVTRGNAKSRHTDTDTDTKKQKPRAFALPAWVPQDAWKTFEEHRGKKRSPMTDRARELIVIKLEKLDPTHANARALLEQSIRKGWLDVFPLKEIDQQQGALYSRDGVM